MGKTETKDSRNNTVKIQLKNDNDTATRLIRDGIPGFVANKLLKKPFKVVENEPPFTVEVEIHTQKTLWNIAPECAVVVEE